MAAFKDEIKTKCTQCLAGLVTTVEELEKDNALVCPKCLKVNLYDIESFKRQRQIILAKVFGNRPENPENN